ncbi:MAG: tetratricopeptide repeat protein [Pseudomonadota bacterium]
MPTCPKCSGVSIRKSRRQSRQLRGNSWFRSAYRCDDCGARFHAVDKLLVSAFATPPLLFLGVVASIYLGSADNRILAGRVPQSTPESDEITPDFLASLPVASKGEIDRLKADVKNGSQLAQFQLAQIYYQEFLRTGDIALQLTSTDMLRSGADQGFLQAQTELGRRYMSGQGVVQDFAQAAEWLKRAAEQGDSSAMFGLGEMARAKQAPGYDVIDAYVWLNLAAARGERDAIEVRDRVVRSLSADELKEAQRKSRSLDESLPRPALDASLLPVSTGL